jgi:glucose uptake protein
MLGTLYAVVTVLAWGIWLAPSQNIPFKNQRIRTFYVAAANLALATLIFFLQGFRGLTWQIFWLPFIGGLVWAVSGFMAFTATDLLGMARAYGLWAPINVGVSILWGTVIFDEFIALRPLMLLMLVISLAIIITGILLIILAKGTGAHTESRRAFWIGVLGALGAGVLWGTYFIPIKISSASTWVASFPLAVGIFAGSTVLVALTSQPLRLDQASEYARVSATGVLWGIGNYAMLLLVEQIGAGRGFTISQLGIVVNGLIGVYVLKDPQPGSRAATLTLIGCILATIGGILLGNLK